MDYFGAAYERVELAMRTFEADRRLPELQKSLSFVSIVSDVLYPSNISIAKPQIDSSRVVRELLSCVAFQDSTQSQVKSS